VELCGDDVVEVEDDVGEMEGQISSLGSELNELAEANGWARRSI
jgi:hypothetical protein